MIKKKNYVAILFCNDVKIENFVFVKILNIKKNPGWFYFCYFFGIQSKILCRSLLENFDFDTNFGYDFDAKIWVEVENLFSL